MTRDNDSQLQWSDHQLVAELERNVLFSQATTMSQNAELIRRVADDLGTTSPLAKLLAAEADRVIFSIERSAQASRGERSPSR